jgi:serine/threonine protein phosphatase PrpC
MALIIGQRGAVKWQTMVQSPVGHAVEAGVIDEVEAQYHEDRHYVSNLAGTPEMYVQVGAAIDLASRDTVILGSDGLFDNLLLDEVIEMGRSGKLIDRIDDLARVANSRMIDTDGDESFGKPDDLTVLLYAA